MNRSKVYAFMPLLPDALRKSDFDNELLYLKAELHYVNVCTLQGNALILFNLKDAIAELPPTLGFQTHRSYWVAHKSVARFEKNGREGRLILVNGECIPISRNHISVVCEKYEVL